MENLYPLRVKENQGFNYLSSYLTYLSNYFWHNSRIVHINLFKHAILQQCFTILFFLDFFLKFLKAVYQ